MFRPANIIELLEKNIARTGNPLGIRKTLLSNWHRNLPLKLKTHGDTMLFTGFMYQLTPYIILSTKYLEKIENTPLEKLFIPYVKLSRYINPFDLISPPGSGIERYTGIVRKIAFILKKSGIDVSYNEELDNYSGILLYDLGDDDAFSEHSRKVSALLEDAGIKRVITIDPHTTYAMKILYPEYSGSNIEVISYLEILAENIKNGDRGNSGGIVIHDSCYYARYLGIIDEPRKILENLGYEIIEPENSGEMTSCCGGPIESISPVFSDEIAKNRIEELKSSGDKIVTMCPICMGNFERCGYPATDIYELICGGLDES